MRGALALLKRAPALGLAQALGLALLLAGCSSREHANPLDPANARTAGHPPGFAAIALSNSVVLTWTGTPGVSTQLLRRADGEADFAEVSPVMDPSRVSFVDTGTLNGVTYHYRLFFVTSKGLSGPPATADATPSRVVAWTTDSGELLRLGADAREIAAVQSNSMGEVTYLTLDPARDLVWAAAFYEQRVLVVNLSIGSQVALTGFGNPEAIAVDPADGSGWFTDFGTGLVHHFLPSGQAGTPSSITGAGRPVGIALDPATHVLWVCDQQPGRVLQFTTAGALLGEIPMTAPSRVAVDSANGEAWVTSFSGGALVHLAADRTVLRTIALTGPIGVAVDPRRGRIWVTDTASGRVLAFRRDGSQEFARSGLPGARDVAVEPLSGEAWVTTDATVARISAGGTLLTTTRGLSAPVGIGLDLVAP